MVEINKLILLSVVASFSFMSSAYSQQIQPRIEGLQADSVYMKLLHEDNKLTIKEDSITVVVDSLRGVYRSNAEGSADSRQQIITFENELFELRAKKATIVDKLNVIEQEWVLNNMGSVKPDESGQTVLIETNSDDKYKYIYESPNVKSNLSDIDYKNLIKAEELEADIEELSDRYAVNYENLLSLSRSYEVTTQQSDAVEIQRAFDSLSMENTHIIDRIKNEWGYIYDNKSFAYSMLMELLGFSDVLQQEAELMRRAQSEISEKHVAGESNVLLTYLVQKETMVEFESLVADKLGLNNLAASLNAMSKKLSVVDKSSSPTISLTERLFIVYESIDFVTKPQYTSSNPIPETAMYDKGVIFRIFVGSFSAKQQPSIFRKTVPVSCFIDESDRYCYYIGGFETYEEAEQAFAALKKRGFRAPQIVVWSDGRERNLTKDPLPMDSSYRLEVAGAEVLPDGISAVVNEIVPNGSITKVGTDKFVVMSLDRQTQADSLVVKLNQLSPELKVSIEKIEAKIEF